MSESEYQGTQEEPETEAPRSLEDRPAGMTKEAWRKMNLTWAMLQGLTDPPSAEVTAAAAGDEGMQAILSMTERVLSAGEEMGLPSDTVLTTLREITGDKGRRETPQPPSQPPPTPGNKQSVI